MIPSAMTEFQQRAVAAGVMKMLRSKHFSICDLDAAAKVLGETLGGADYDALRAVHCVDYADMGPDLARMVREKCLELLKLPPATIDVLRPAPVAPEPAATPTRGLRLAWWK